AGSSGTDPRAIGCNSSEDVIMKRQVKRQMAKVKSQKCVWAREALLCCLAFTLYGADADLILQHGKIVTVDSKFSIQQAIAIKDGKISAVGSDGAVMKERGPHTKLIDLASRTALPGLIDSHVH